MYKRTTLLLSCLTLLWAGCTQPAAQKKDPEPAKVAKATNALIPRTLLFGSPERSRLRLSPDGTKLAFIAPKDGVQNVWVAPVDKISDAKVVTDDTKRGIRAYFWAWDSQTLVYVQDKGGDENWHVYSVPSAGGEAKDLTPLEGVRANIVGSSPKFPKKLIVGLNDRDKRFHDLYTLNLADGTRTLLQKNDGYAGFVLDHDLKVRLAQKMLPTGAKAYEKKTDAGFAPFLEIPYSDASTTFIVGFDGTNQTLYMGDSREQNVTGLVSVDLQTGAKKAMWSPTKADLNNVMTHPTTHAVEAAGYNHARQSWHYFDPETKARMEALQQVSPGADVSVVSRTLDDTKWLIHVSSAQTSGSYHLFDTKTKKATFLLAMRPELDKQPLVPMHPVTIKSRDGLELVSYLSLPADVAPKQGHIPTKPVPMVLLVHGGPWARDRYGYNSIHQWLTNRGYAVLSVNFRGSTGFGKAFLNAGDLEWAKKMHDDLLDAVAWATTQKIADPAKVAIMGGSYGGYATLVGLTATPKVFAAGVDIVGPSNLQTLLASIPPYWAPIMAMFKKRVGDPSTPEGQALLKERSPLTHVDKIERPLLIGQGANDPRVKQAESDQIVSAMQARKIPVTYALYPDEGHGFARPPNSISFFATAELFLSKHLGGRFQPIEGDFQGSSLQIKAGMEELPELKAPYCALEGRCAK